MITVRRDLVADLAGREPGSTPPPPAVVGSAPVTRRWALAVAVLVAVLPVITDPAGWFVFVAARWFVVVAAAGLLLGGLAATRSLRQVPAVRWWGSLVGVAVFSAIGSGAARVALLGTNDRRAGAAMWLAHATLFVVGAMVVRRRSHLRLLLRGMAVGVITVTVLVAAQRVGWSFPSGVGSRVRPGGPLGNADFLGAYSALALLVAIGAAVDRAEHEVWRIVHLVAGMGAAFCLVVSGTRAAWLGVVFGLVAFTVIAARTAGVPLRAAWASVGLVAVGLVGLGMWSGMGDRLDTMASGTAAGRLATWERTASVIGERPVVGWGPEGFAEGFGRSVDDGWEREYGRRLLPDRAHNGLLDVGVSLGLVGLALYLGTLAATGRAVRRTLRTAPSPAVVGVVAALVAYLVQQQFLFQLFDVDALAWLLAGAVVGIGAARSTADSSARRSVDAIRSIGARSFASPRLATVAAIPTSTALVVVAVLGLGGLRADRSARLASDGLASGSGSGSAVAAASAAFGLDPQVMSALVLADTALANAVLAMGDDRSLSDVRERLGQVRDATFDDGRLTLARARLARARGLIADIDDSRSEVAALLGVDPSRSDAWAEMGELDLALGDAPTAQRSFERAVAVRPTSSSWWVRLAVAADRAGDVATAADAIGRVDPAALDADGGALRRRLLAGTAGRSSAQ